MKEQPSVTEKEYQKLDKVLESNKMEEDKTKNKRSWAKSNIVYKYRDTKEFAAKRFCNWKQNHLKEFKSISATFYHDLIKIMPNNEDNKERLNKRNGF